MSLKICSTLSQFVRTLIEAEWPAGFHRVIWDSRNDAGLRVASGVYFVRMQARKAVLER